MIGKQFSQFILAAVTLVSASLSYAAVSPDGIWSDVHSRGGSESQYRTIRADTSRLEESLRQAPEEGSAAAALEVFLPAPDGGYIRLGAYEYFMMAPKLRQQFPEIKTYKLRGLDDRRITGRVDIGSRGFHGMLSTPIGRVYIEPEINFNKSAARDSYRSFNHSTEQSVSDTQQGCQVEGHKHDTFLQQLASKNFSSAPVQKQAGDRLRTYRLAMAGTAEYTAAVSSGAPTVAQGQAAIVTTINRINEIFEKEVSVRFQLVGNNASIVFTDTATDGYSCSEASKPLAQQNPAACPGNNINIPDSHSTLFDNNLAQLDATIGNANYDLGHVLSTVGGGLAGLGVVCDSTAATNRKSYGSTGSFNPSGESFIVDLLAHEMGHQLGASHTFNASGSGSCTNQTRADNSGSGNNFGAASALEVGSGTTIMSYSGICSDQNVQFNSDDYFHARSLEQMREVINGEVPFSNINGSICGTDVATGNSPPDAEAGANYTIPGGTPFALTGSATDADPGDVASLTYTWEQFDLGVGTANQTQMHTDLGSGPLVRSRRGTTSPTRYIPTLDAILERDLDKNRGERLPETDRDMNFRLTVRSGDQGFDQDDMTVTVDKDSGPLVVTAPAAASVHSGLSSTAVTWNVANTTAAPVNCANMEITYSNDGGQDFPTVLLASTPNDGSQNVTLPNETTTQGRIKVQCVNNIFFNVSPGDFDINAVGSLSIAATSAVKEEGDTGNTAYTFTITRSGVTAGTAAVNYAVTSATANAADFGGALPSGVINFANGDTTETLTINVSGDNAVESDETFTVTLSSPTNAVIGLASANGTIQNDDGIVSIAATSAIKAEGDSGNTAYTFTITRSGVTAGTAAVNYAVSSVTANAADFGGSLPSGTINFANGVASEALTINVSGDNTVEGDESFTVTLSNPSNVVIGTASANGTIQNDDGTLSIAATSAVKAEGDAGNTAYTFTISRTDNTAGAASVNYAVTGIANASDFGGSLPSGTINFADGDASETLTINVSGDNTVEGNESFTVTLSNPSNAVIGTASANGTIQNDDGTLSIAATSAVKAEGDAGNTAYTFTISRAASTAGATSVNYAVTGAADAADFGGSLPSGTINFADGVASETLTINVSGDDTVEGDESFTVTLSNPSNAVIGTASASGTIQNDDGTLSIAATSAMKAEGDAGNTAYTFTISRAASTAGAASVNYAVTGTADAADFGGSLPSGTVNFADGVASETLTINVSGDNTVEGDEPFTVTLSNPSNAVIGTASANGTIQNDDGGVSIAATSAVKAEGDAGTTAYTFTLTRSGDTSGVATVNYTVSGAAVNAADFGGSLPSGVITFADGDGSETLTINVSGDNEVENNEVFTVTIGNPVNAVIGAATASGTIQNDDGSLAIAASSAVKPEGDVGPTAYTFTVTRSSNTAGAVSVDYAVTSATADVNDFGGIFPTGTINFADGEVSETLTVNVSGDQLVEANENFTVTLSNPTNTVITTASANGTIQNDDGSFSIAATSTIKPEGDAGTTAYTFTITRASDTSGAASVDYALTSVQADAADFGGALPSGTINFADGVASQSLTINVVGDNAVEANEGFTVTLNNPANAVITTAVAAGIIQNDDGSLAIAATSAVKAEGDAGNTPYTFTITRSNNASGAASVNYAVSSATASASDFGGAFPSGTINFANGVVSQIVTINVAGDSTVETDEVFTVTLSSPSNAVLTTAAANGTIQNDDSTVSIAANSAVKAEGNTGTTAYTFTITRADNTLGVASVNYAVTSSTADAADFGGSLPSGTINFANGGSSETLTINVSADADVESNEDFTVTLSAPVNTVIGTASADGTIENDDAALAISTLNADRLESEGTFTFTVTRSGDTTTAVSASYLVSGTGSNAADASDFGGSFPSGAVGFASGVTSQTISISVSNDIDVESVESFLVTLSTPSAGAIISTATAEGTIKNDDGPVTYSITALAADQAEGNTGTSAFTFNVIRSGNPLTVGTETIDYAVTGSGANAATAADFGGAFASGTVTFGVGQHTQLVTVSVSGDQDLEANEGFTVTLSNASAGSISVATADGVIQNDDAALSISEPTVIPPANNGQYTFVFTITRTAGVVGASSVDYAVAGSGSNPVTAADFGGSFPTGTVNFASGQNSAEVRVVISSNVVTSGDKSFTITISNPVNAAIAVSSATGTLSGSGTAPITLSSSGGGGGAVMWWLLLLFAPLMQRRK